LHVILYKLGVDGVSMPFVLLTAFLMPICIVASWSPIQTRVKEYMICFLALETLLLLTISEDIVRLLRSSLTWSVRLADCLSQGDFWPAETHRDPSGDKPQHELAGVTIIIRKVISKRDAVSSVLCHDPHFKGRRTCRKAVPVHRQPMSLGKVEEHSRIATCGNDPPGRRIRLEPVLFKILLPRHTLHSILSI